MQTQIRAASFQRRLVDVAGVIRLRFVTGSDALSAAIRWRTNFWASHVEARVSPGMYIDCPDGGYLGAHADGGVQIRPIGYDKETMTRELLVFLPTTEDIANKFYAGLKKHVGEPYDFETILGFVLNTHLHDREHAICSALQASELCASGYFEGELSRHNSEIDPADLLLVLTGRTVVRGAR